MKLTFKSQLCSALAAIAVTICLTCAAVTPSVNAATFVAGPVA